MVTFRVNDMTCGHCASAIARAVASVDKAARVDVNVGEKLVSVTSSAPESELAAAIAEAGYTAEPAQVAAGAAPQRRGCCCR